jgi:hypothetical protein
MEKKQKINAKRFVEDFRAGKSDLELMHAHDLSPATLDKVIRALVAKKLLDDAEVARRSDPDAVFQEQSFSYPEPLDWASHAAEMRRLSGSQTDKSSFCPQCGAQVSKSMLTCPECGHVIPGQDRWAEAEPKTSFLNRLSPKTIGCLLALPILVALIFFFVHIIFPMAETVGEKRAQAVRKEIPHGKTPMEAARDMAKAVSRTTIRGEVTRYVDDQILSSAKEDYSAFTVGPKWESLSLQEKETFVQEMSLTLEGSGLKKTFRLVAPSGKTVAKVVDGTALWRDETGGLTFTPAPREENASDLDEIPQNPVQRALERLPGGGGAIRNLPGR